MSDTSATFELRSGDQAFDGTTVVRELGAALRAATLLAEMSSDELETFAAKDPEATAKILDRFAIARDLIALAHATVNGARGRLQGAAGAPRESLN